MKAENVRLGQTVYHKDVYRYREPLKVIGITEDKLLLEGDYSGGTNNVTQSTWLLIDGASYIKDFERKKEYRKLALDIETLAIPVDPNHDTMTRAMFDMLNAVLILTAEVDYEV
jgi:hypothetical protein